MAAGATTLLDQAVLNIAIPSMRHSLGAAAADIQWIVAGFLHSASGSSAGSGPRAAYAFASCVCAGLLAAALVLSRLREATAATRSPRPEFPALRSPRDDRHHDDRSPQER
ncbi:hypothetical protein ACFV2H_44290 [Streptomyces sp. NPDC059629]|uniref:hypothetical protein n=1 Tax=Streptomyces sp. NPDC059629 TaxID=3346889 RepID=UPI0036CBD5DC